MFLEPPDRKGISYHGRSGWANDWVTNWTSTDACPYWEVDVVRAGRYEITLMYICPELDVGARLCVEVGGQRVECIIEKPHDPDPIPRPDLVERKEVY